MKVKDILPLCPRYRDNSGYDITIRQWEEAPGKSKWLHTKRIPSDWDTGEYPEWVCESEVKEIRAGWPLAGGNYDESLNIII